MCERRGVTLPVCRHRSRGRFLPLILEGNHGVGTQVPRPGLDLIEGKLEEILLRSRREDTCRLSKQQPNRKTLIAGAGVYLRELKRSVGQRRGDPVGTFGHVTVKLG